MKVKIRKAKLSDLKDIQNLNKILCEKENKEFDKSVNKNYPVTREGRKYFEERIKKDFVLVALVDKKIIGYIIGAISEIEDYRNISKLAEAENMLVLKDYRSKGIGKKLFDEFIRWSKTKKAERVRAVASAKNSKAIEFYRREGFKDHDLVLEKEIK